MQDSSWPIWGLLGTVFDVRIVICPFMSFSAQFNSFVYAS